MSRLVLGVVLVTVAVVALPVGRASADGVPMAWFTHQIFETSGGWIQTTTVGDLNGDGRNDVVVSTDRLDGTVELYAQTADHSMADPVVIDTLGTMQRIVDVTGDGRADLVNFTPAGLRIRAQLANGSLAPATTVDIATPNGIGEVGDYTGDGRIDVVLVRDDNSVSLLAQQANGTLAAPVTLATYSAYPAQVVLQDVNGDHRLDLAVWHGTGTIEVRTQQANGTLAAHTTVTVPGDIRDFVLADFNGDGRVDVATSHNFNGTSYVIYRNANLSWGAPVALNEPGDPVFFTSTRTGDLDGDGKIDLVLVKSHTDAYVYLQGAGGLAATPIEPGHSVLQWPTRLNASIGDVNGDGADDIVTTQYYGRLSVSYNATAQTVSGIVGTISDGASHGIAGLTADIVGAGGGVVATTTTDASGHYRFSNRVITPQTPYRLRVTDPSHVRPTVWYSFSGAKATSDQADSLTYLLGSAMTADLVVPLAASASGKVVDGRGANLAGIQVALVAAGDTGAAATATTAANGTFTAGGLLPGSYTVAVTDPTSAHEPEWWGLPGRARSGAGTTIAVAGPTTALGTHAMGAAACPQASTPGVVLDGKTLTGCWLQGVNLNGRSLQDADLAGTYLADADLRSADLDGADLTRTNLFLARLAGSSRTGVDYDHTTCPDGTISDANADTCEGHLASPTGSDAPVGSLLEVTATPGIRARGWAVDGNVTATVTVRITVDGANAAEVAADLPSSEAAAAQPLYGPNRGFDVNLGVLSPGIHEVCAWGLNLGPGTDARLGCKVVESPVNKARFIPLAPTRILDTRFGTGTGGSTARLGPNGTLDLTVLGAGGVPADHVGAVVLNVTVTEPTAPSFLTVWPTSMSRPTASNLNFVPGQTVPNLVVAKVGANGQVRIGNLAGSVHVVADVAGYFDDGMMGGGGYHPVSPVRLLDTRNGTGGTVGPLGPGGVAHLQVGGTNGVPLDATSVVLNVTAVGSTTPSYLTAFPTGTPRPLASNLNFAGGQIIANLVVVKLSPQGRVDLANTFGDVHVVADLAGWFDVGDRPASTYNPLPPARILDTRVSATPAPPEPIPGGSSRHVQATGVGGVPAGATAVVVNLTVTNPTETTFLTAYPMGTPLPVASNLNVVAGQTAPNLVIVKVSPTGWIDIFNAAGSADVIVDVQGWFG